MPEIEVRAEDEVQASRKPYHSPEFREYGTVVDMTQQGATGRVPDNTTGAGTYIAVPVT